MGGHSKKSGKGGGGGSRHGGRGNVQERKKLTKDPGVPNLKALTKKLTHTAQNRTHSVLSIPALARGGSRVPAMGLLAHRMMQSSEEHGMASLEVSEEQRLANERRAMTSLALRASENGHSYENPLDLYGDNGDAEDRFGDDADRRGSDLSLHRFVKTFHRVVESCDVLLQVLDARDPLGCRLSKMEQDIRSSYGDRKKLVVVLNKVDMLPSKEVIDSWIYYFEHKENIMCIPFSATAKGSSGQSYVSDMFRRLRELARNEDTGDRKAIVVAVIGYPNVGKSSIINALKRKNVVGVGNMPGFTTGNTEVELRSDIRVLDCPGVVSPGEDSGDVVLRNAVKVSDLQNPFLPVQRLLQRCTSFVSPTSDEDNNDVARQSLHAAGVHPLGLFYGIGSFDTNDVMGFITQVGLRRGRLTKGSAVDEEGTARMILKDWNDGRIAYYTMPPEDDGFFNAPDGAFRAVREENEEGCSGPELVATASRGITFDGLPTFHLWLSRTCASVGKKKYTQPGIGTDD